jgi:transcriptional regulator with XRE-family HTH domain
MSFKDNYIKFAEKFGGPASNEMIEKIGQSAVSSIMRGSDVGVSVAYKAAKALGVTVEDLAADEKEQGAEEHKKVAEGQEGYGEKLDPEEGRYVSKLMAILQGKNDAIKELITCFLDTVASNKEWIAAGQPERRKRRPALGHKGRHERRKRIHSY